MFNYKEKEQIGIDELTGYINEALDMIADGRYDEAYDTLFDAIYETNELTVDAKFEFENDIC
jgi:hypothetical protein